jgi:hypothetical protein
MSRTLDAACKIAFIHEGEGINTAIEILMDHNVRGKYIEKALESECFKEDDPEITKLLTLNEYDKQTGKAIGTKENQIDFILDRISILEKDIYLRRMLKAKINYDINFTKWIDEGKTILFQMPEETFSSKQTKDTILTYLTSRVMLSSYKRKNPKRVCHIVTDEVHQIKTCTALLSDFITEVRKYGLGFYFSAHNLRQLRVLHDSIRSAGCSYMILAGSEKESFIALREELKPYEIEDGLSLKPFHSLNLITYGNQYAKFISKLPKPL